VDKWIDRKIERSGRVYLVVATSASELAITCRDGWDLHACMRAAETIVFSRCVSLRRGCRWMYAGSGRISESEGHRWRLLRWRCELLRVDDRELLIENVLAIRSSLSLPC
jgi:hypothetical protein